MGFQKKLFVLPFILLLVFHIDSTLAKPNGQKLQNQTLSLNAYYVASSNDKSLYSQLTLDGVSYEMAVRLGLPLGALIRAKARSENLNHEQSTYQSLEQGQTKSQNHK